MLKGELGVDYSVINGNFVEENLEQAIISIFQKQCYTYVMGENINRRYEDILLVDDLREYINARYNAANLSEVEIQEIINELDSISEIPLYAGNKNAVWLINEGFNLVREDTNLDTLHVEYINFDEPKKNVFKIVSQYTVQGSYKLRPDLLVFINGIPVAIFELKTISTENITIHDV
ncbi:MAG: hypothetical protein LUD41_00095 [Phascolarctobacterium sp.]|nr:hypothetical protein [Phascolarctobacterium sp.]